MQQCSSPERTGRISFLLRFPILVYSIENLASDSLPQLKPSPYLSTMQSAYELGPPISDASMAKESSYEISNAVDRDRTDLLRLGKKQVLKAWISNV